MFFARSVPTLVKNPLNIFAISAWSFVMSPLLFKFAGKSCVLCAFPMVVRNIFQVPAKYFMFPCNNKQEYFFFLSAK